ncbi:MAG: 3'-5' exonuclease, partial [Hyphomicrobiales bacterium]
PKRRLAREIAEEISGWLTNKVILEAQGRPIRPGDILVLVRRRNDFVDMLVRELKSRAIPVAGVDRMQLAKQIVVQDLLALARFALLPQDDLSLAALLKSPLIGLDEEALFDLAHDRKGSLWATLRSRAVNDETLREAERRLSKWLSMADFKPPHDFFADILATNDNRARIFARLGVEAADPIEEFLNAAMNFARTQIPTLEGFLGWLGRDDINIKRDLEHGQNQVRVMTVHGAKGLEANIVFLPDTCAIPSTSQGSGLCDLTLPGAFAGRDAVVMPVWPGAAASTLPALARARDEQKTLDMQEHSRLAYVAMTRARDWLIVCGYQGKNKRPDDCWYDLISTGLDDDLETFTAPNGDQRRRIRATRAMPRAPQPSIEAAPDDTGQTTDLPAWARTPAPAESREAVLRPSIAVTGTGAGGRLSPLAELRERRFTRGRLLHALLERLPALAAVQRAGAA